MIGRLPAILAAVFLLAAPGGSARAQQEDPDRIPRFAAEIAVAPDGDLLVTEEIDFLVTPGSEKRGIYRDLPTQYRNAWGITERVGYEVLEVTRDGRAEPYALESTTFGLRVRIGSYGVYLESGVHRYRIVYRTANQLFFRDDADEVYWNVTGNDWAHPIDLAQASVILPPGAAALEATAYTGAAGNDGSDFIQGSGTGGAITFAATRPLQPGEGLTVAVSFPKGFVAGPTPEERLQRAVDDNLGLLAGLAGLAVTLAYFWLQWLRVGRDPEPGVIIPLFEAPAGLSPAATGYVWARTLGRSMDRALAFTVALTSLGIKGRLRIEEDGWTYSLKKLPEAKRTRRQAKLPPGEASVMQALFDSRDHDTVEVTRTYSKEIDAAVDKLLDTLSREHGKAYFRHNSGLWFLGALLAIGTIAGACLLQTGDSDTLVLVLFGAVFAVAFSVPVVLTGRSLLPQWRKILQGREDSPGGTLALTLFAGLFALVPLGVAGVALHFFGLALVATLAALLFVIALFWHLMKAPTRLGRALLDEIEGYRHYLCVAEADRLNMLTAEPKMTVAHFEHHLPYAMALGVEEEWTARFTARADAASRRRAEAQSRSWYRRRAGASNLRGMTTGLAGGLSRTLTSAATRPSSSSGSSGGGSSGGGSGGGGGGSW